MSKKEKFIQTIKQQFNIKLQNDKENIFNKNRNVLYTKIDYSNQREVLGYLIKNNITFNSHYNCYYWIYS